MPSTPPSSLSVEEFGSYFLKNVDTVLCWFLKFSLNCFYHHCTSLPPIIGGSVRDHEAPSSSKNSLPPVLPTEPRSMTCNIAQARRKLTAFNCQMPSQGSLQRTDLKPTKVLLDSVDLYFLSLCFHCLLLALWLCQLLSQKSALTCLLSNPSLICTPLSLPRLDWSILDKLWCRLGNPESSHGVMTALTQSDS